MLKLFFFTLLLVMGVMFVFPGLGRGLSLREAVDMALVNNPDIERQRMSQTLSERDLAEKNLKISGKSGWWRLTVIIICREPSPP